MGLSGRWVAAAVLLLAVTALLVDTVSDRNVLSRLRTAARSAASTAGAALQRPRPTADRQQLPTPPPPTTEPPPAQLPAAPAPNATRGPTPQPPRRSPAPASGWVTEQTGFKHCLTLLRGFCVASGKVLIFDAGRDRPYKTRLHVCNEATKRAKVPVLRLPALSAPPAPPEPLPAVVLSFWGTVGYHLLQRLIPTHKLMHDLNWTDAVVYMHSKSKSALKMGSASSWDSGGSNYNWGLLRTVTREPANVHALHLTPEAPRCYRRGFVGGWRMFEGDPPFSWRRDDVPRFRQSVLRAYGVASDGCQSPPASSRLTIVQRQPRYGRTMANAAEAADLARGLGLTARVVEWEGMPLAEQLRVVHGTDVLMGVHGNGLFWVALLARGSVLVQAGHRSVLKLLGWNYGRLADAAGVLHIEHVAAIGHESGPNSVDMGMLRGQLLQASEHVRKHKTCA